MRIAHIFYIHFLHKAQLPNNYPIGFHSPYAVVLKRLITYSADNFDAYRVTYFIRTEF